MGMFDYILLECDTQHLPHQIDKSFVPQTKSLDNTMATYIIHDNKLMRRHRTWKETDEILSEDTFFGTVYNRVIDKEWEEEVPFHGDIKVITKEENNEETDLLRLLVRFTHGKLEWIHIDTEEMEHYAKIKKKLQEVNNK